MFKNCLYCNKQIEKKYFCSLKAWNNRVKYCSKRCMDLYRTNKPSPSPETTFKKGHKTVIGYVRRGSENNKWKGGITPIHEKIRKSQEYKKWRLSVFTRDNYTCQKCGQRGGELHADHDLPFAFFPDLRFEVLNGQTLCISCHKKTDTYGRSFYMREIQLTLNN